MKKIKINNNSKFYKILVNKKIQKTVKLNKILKIPIFKP